MELSGPWAQEGSLPEILILSPSLSLCTPPQRKYFISLEKNKSRVVWTVLAFSSYHNTDSILLMPGRAVLYFFVSLDPLSTFDHLNFQHYETPPRVPSTQRFFLLSLPLRCHHPFRHNHFCPCVWLPWVPPAESVVLNGGNANIPTVGCPESHLRSARISLFTCNVIAFHFSGAFSFLLAHSLFWLSVSVKCPMGLFLRDKEAT